MDDFADDYADSGSAETATTAVPETPAIDAWFEPPKEAPKPQPVPMTAIDSWFNPSKEDAAAADQQRRVGELNQEVQGHVEHLMGGTNTDGSKRFATEPTNEAIDQQLGNRLDGQSDELKQHVRDQYRGALLRKMAEQSPGTKLGRTLEHLTGDIPFASGVQGAVKSYELYHAAKNMKDNGGTLDDYQTIAAWMREQKRLEKRGLGAKIAENVEAAPASIYEFIKTGGWSGLGKAVGLKSGEELAKETVKQILGRVTRQAVVGGVERTIANAPRLVEGYYQQKMPSVSPTGEVGDIKSDAEAATNAGINRLIQETAFSAMGAAPGGTILSKIESATAGGVVKGTLKGTALNEASAEGQLQATSTGKGSTINRLVKGDPKALQDFTAQLVAFAGIEGAVALAKSPQVVQKHAEVVDEMKSQGYSQKAIEAKLAPVYEAVKAAEESGEPVKLPIKTLRGLVEYADALTQVVRQSKSLRRQAEENRADATDIQPVQESPARREARPAEPSAKRTVVAPESSPVASEPAGRVELPQVAEQARVASQEAPADAVAAKQGLVGGFHVHPAQKEVPAKSLDWLTGGDHHWQTYPEPRLSEASRAEAAKRDPLPLPKGGEEVAGQVKDAWDIVSRLWPEMASKVKQLRGVDLSQHNARGALNKDGILFVPKGKEVTPGTLWHELVHLEQHTNGRMKPHVERTNAEHLEIEREAYSREGQMNQMMARPDESAKPGEWKPLDAASGLPPHEGPINENAIHERIAKADLTDDQRQILGLQLNGGKIGGRPRSLREIGAELGISHEEVRKRSAEAVEKLNIPGGGSIDNMLRGIGKDRLAAMKAMPGKRAAAEGMREAPLNVKDEQAGDAADQFIKQAEAARAAAKHLTPEQEKAHADLIEEGKILSKRAKRKGSSAKAIEAAARLGAENAEPPQRTRPAAPVRPEPEPAAAGRDQPVPGEGAAGPADDRPRTGPGSRGGVIRKPRAGASLNAQVRYMGGIDPNSEAFKAHYSSQQEAIQDGIPLNVFKKGGNGLDTLAGELENNGYIRPLKGEDNTETLLNMLRNREEHRHHDSTPEVEKQFEEHYRQVQEAADVRAAKEEALAAKSDMAEGAIEEVVRGSLRDKIEDEAADASFDFGANEVPAARSAGGRQLDMYGNKEPIKFRSRKGGQVTMDDALRETTMRKAEEYADDHGLKIVRREAPNRFWTEDGTKYEVGKAEDGYPITAVDGPPRADRMTARDLEEAFIAEGIQKGRSTAQQADFTDPAQPGNPEIAAAQSRTRKGVDNLRYNWRELSGEQYPRVADKSESAADAMVRFASSHQHAERAAPYYIDAILKDVTDYKVPADKMTQKDRDAVGKLFMEAFHEERFRHAREQYHTLSDKAFDRASRADAALRKVRRQLQTETDPIEIKNLKRERDGLKKLRDDSEKQGKEWRRSAEAVVTFVGGYNSELGRESKYQDTLKNKGYQEFSQRWTKEVVPLMDKFYKMAEGMEPDAEIDSLTQLPGRPFNAKAIKEGDNTPAENIVRVAGSKSGDLRNPKLYKLGFARRFTGASSRGYDVNPAAVIEHSIRESVKTGTKAEMFRELEKAGLLKWGKPGERHNFDGKAGEVFPDINPPKGTQMAGEGETRAFVHPDIKSDLRKALDLNERWGQYQAAKFITGASLTSLVEATTHGKNNFSMIWKPGVMPQDVIKSFAGVIKQDPATWKRIVELAELGAVKSHGLESASLDLKYDPTKYVRMVSGKLLEVTDTAMRLTMDKAFDRLAARGWAEDTPANRRNFINQVGQYNRLSQNKYVQWLRDTGWGPFATAATNYTAQGIRALMLSPGVKATGLRGAVLMRAEMLLRNSVAMGLVAATNYALWNSVFGDDKTPLGSIKLRNLPGGKSLTFDVGGLVGLPRGARTLGLLALAEGARANAPKGAVAEKFAEDVTHGLTHPAEGPAYQFLHGAATGHNSIGMPIAPDVHDKNFTTRAGEIGRVQKFQDVLGAIKNLNPTLAALLGWARPRAKGERSDWETGSQLLGPIAPKVRSVPPIPTQERRSVSVPVKPGR